VPPPPVGGATVGTGLGDGLGVTVGDGVAVAVAVGDGLGDGEVDSLGVAVGEAVSVAVSVAVGVAEVVAPGEDEGSAADPVADVQAETSAEMSMAKMAQPTVVSLALNPVRAVVACLFMEPPRPSGRTRRRFPVPLQKPAPERQTRGWLLRCPRRLKAGPRKRRGP
jgi:hypothetical protein